jgi:hypothetical protein
MVTIPYMELWLFGLTEIIHTDLPLWMINTVQNNDFTKYEVPSIYRQVFFYLLETLSDSFDYLSYVSVCSSSTFNLVIFLEYFPHYGLGKAKSIY